jgi:hypothetical protein
MPRAGSSPQDTTDIAGDLGRVIVSHFGLIPEDLDSFYPESNPKRLFFRLKSGTEERRAIVVDADKPKEELDPVERLKVLFEDMSAAERSNALDSLGLLDRPSAPADPDLLMTSVFDLESIFSTPEPVEYLIDPEIPSGAVVYLAGPVFLDPSNDVVFFCIMPPNVVGVATWARRPTRKEGRTRSTPSRPPLYNNDMPRFIVPVVLASLPLCPLRLHSSR